MSCDNMGVDLSQIEEFGTLETTESQKHLLKLCHLTYMFDCAEMQKTSFA